MPREQNSDRLVFTRGSRVKRRFKESKRATTRHYAGRAMHSIPPQYGSVHKRILQEQHELLHVSA
jgi:hypothetical protein